MRDGKFIVSNSGDPILAAQGCFPRGLARQKSDPAPESYVLKFLSTSPA